jgi:hypothetical protein
MDKDEMRKDLERQEKDVLEQIKRLEGHDAQPIITSDGGDLGPTTERSLAQARDMLEMIRKALGELS